MGAVAEASPSGDLLRTLGLWSVFGLASIGFASTLGGLAFGYQVYVGAGLATMAFAGLLVLGGHLLRTTSATPGAAAPRKVEWEASATPEPVEELVEFELVPEKEPDPEPAAEGAWPQVTEELWQKRRAREPLPPGEFEVPPAFRRREQFTQDLPIVKSVFEGSDPDDGEARTRGQCSACNTYLWAPKKRPIQLRCPNCGKVALLTA